MKTGYIYETKEFKENTKRSRTKDGRHKIDCKKGLWGVSCISEQKALKEAGHYFMQYYQDGEYA